MRRPKLLLLDAGNTLVFLDMDAVSGAARDAGVEVAAARLADVEPVAKRRYGEALGTGLSHEDGWHLYMRVLFESAGVGTEDAERAARSARVEHDRFNLWRRVPGGLTDALVRAHQGGVRTAIVSNSEGQLMALLARLGIASHFEFVIDSALEGVRKPDPEIFRRALVRAGVEARDALYAGDIPEVDVQGARSAGMEGVLIDPWQHFPDYRDAPRFDSVASLVRAMGL